MHPPLIKILLRALHPAGLLFTGLAALLGAALALACGCGGDPAAVAVAAGLAVLGHVAVQWWAASHRQPSPDARLRDAADVLMMVVVGAGVLLIARSGPGLLLVGASALALVLGPAGRKSWAGVCVPAPLAAGLCSALVVVGIDAVQRHALSWMSVLTGVGIGLSIVARSLAVAEGPSTRGAADHTVVSGSCARPGTRSSGGVGWMLAASGAGHGWILLWWGVDWLASTAWWALAAVPFSIGACAAGFVGRWRAARYLSTLAILVQGLLLVAASVAVIRLR